MKLSLSSSCLALFALLRTTLSNPNGAGRCVVGEAAPKGFHADPEPNTGGSLSDGSFVLEVNGDQVTPSDGTIFVPPDTDFNITLSGGDFRGFLIMLGGQAEGALAGNGPEAQQAFGFNCAGTASITHTSNDVKQSVTVTGNLPAGTATTIEVNVVVQNSGGVSIYNYDQFALEAGVPVTLPTETGSPTGSPVAATQVPASSPATESPVGSPVEGNATSIADLVMATPELSDLASFLTTDLIAALSGDGPFTVFAPTNDAFDKIPEDVIAALAADEAALVDVLTYHVLDSIVFSTDLVEGAVVTALNGDNLTVTSLDPVTINDSVVITADIEADNGVVHLIDTVLIPPADETATAAPTGSPVTATQVPTASSPATESPVGSPVEGNATSVGELIMTTPELSDLATAFTTDLIATLYGDGPFTVFAPTNDAFDKLPEDVIATWAADEATLVDVLTYHVLDSIVFSTDLVEGAVITALNGDNLTVTSLDPVTINDSIVTAADIEASNGVVHLIDTILIPPEDEAETGTPTASPVEETDAPPPIETPEIANYIAIIEPIPGVVSNVSGTMFVSTIGDDGTLFYGGFLSGLQPDLDGNDPECGAVNGCGVHLHSGFGCEDNDAQGGHYFVDPVAEDPWVDARYTSDGEGSATHGAILNIGTSDVVGRAFLVHAQDGSRIGCGILQPRSSLSDLTEFEATTTPLESGQPAYPFVNGYVNVMVNTPAGDETIEELCYVGYASGLMPNVESFLRGGDACNVTNGCGTHIHAGFSCEPDEQLGHWYNEELEVDPWLLLGYESTDEEGNAVFGDCTRSGYPALDAEARAFIVHGSDGSRVSCGLLQVLIAPPVEGIPTASPIAGTDDPTPAPLNETVAPSTLAPVNETIAPSTMAPVNETMVPSTLAPSTSAPAAAPVSIADLVFATPELSTLANLLTEDLIAALSGDGPFTVFAPVNDAFDNLPADVVSALMADEEALVDVLTYHVVSAVLSSTDLRVVPVTTALNGDVLTVTSRDPLILNGAATVIAADIEATNGVVHLIDAVLIPPEDQVPDVDEPCADCPPLVVKGNNRRPSESWPLGLCEGDCDIDSDCAGDLVCFKSEDADTVPGCSGTRPTRPRDDNKVDYCYNPNR